MYIKSISEFITDTEQTDHHLRGGVVQILSDETGTDNRSEMDSWGASLPLLANILRELPDGIRNECEICLEAGYGTDERADAVIVGKRGDRTVVIIIENKQWSRLNEYAPITELCLRDPYHDSDFVEHPCHQVSRYKYILENINGYCQDNDAEVFAAVFMHNATEEERRAHAGPFDGRFADIIKEVPVFVGLNGTDLFIGQNLREYIEDKLDGGENGLARMIYSSERKESEAYRNAVAGVFGNREQLLKLLDEDQIAIFEEIRQRVLSHQAEKTVFIIEGDPGTGKTFIAQALMAYLYGGGDGLGGKVKLVLKNRDPRRALERMGMPHAAVTFGLKNDHTSYNCLICDESHRMLEQVWSGKDNRDNIEVIIGQSNVSVFFYDSKQRVHINDYITADRIKEKAREMGIPDDRMIERRLVYQHRCLDSDHFMQLVDRILYEPEKGLDGIAPFDEDETYQVRLVNTPRELFCKIKELNRKKPEGEKEAKGSRVLAGKGRTKCADRKGETKWVDWQWMNDDEALVRRKTIGPFRNDENKYVWNLHTYPAQLSFASDDPSVDLVGCLDTSQGLDFEYVGLILAPDIEYDAVDHIVRVNLDGHQEKDPNLDIEHHRNDEEELKSLIRNTYRVLASRGAKGCFIYCCDEGLQNYLGTLIPTMNVEVPSEHAANQDERGSDAQTMVTERKIMYIGNKFNRSFHYPACRYAPKIPQKRVEFATREEAVKAEYKPCENCKP